MSTITKSPVIKKAYGLNFTEVEGYAPLEGSWEKLSNTLQPLVHNPTPVQIKHEGRQLTAHVYGFFKMKARPNQKSKSTVFIRAAGKMLAVKY